MGVTADLKIKLYANDVVVAESDDTSLWNQVFSSIAKGNAELLSGDGDGIGEDDDVNSGNSKSLKTPIDEFAKELGVEVDELVGACHPTDDVPFIHLDEQYWEALRGHTGSRGKNAVAPIALAITLLALWQKYRTDGNIPSVAEGKAVLETIYLEDKNPARSLKNCEWLQERSGGWIINPAKRSQAAKLATSYVKQESPVTK